ncbi:MAG: succinate dehydrogenase [Bacteroidota bacterium]|jgi:succinate dehydrogenase / fumarate reductase cytochrome b subunit|nr:succinate dehydrogenase [Bacteroidota bacterium]
MSNTSKNFLQSSIGKKLVMGLTGLFLISFLVVHCFLNAFIFFNDGGLMFNVGAMFMAKNPLIRAMEYVLFIGLIWHMVQALILTIENNKARPINYAYHNGSANSKWYSRSMGILGTLLLLFLIVHLAHFWVKSRFTGLPGEDANGNENLYAVMQQVFAIWWVVVIYVTGCISLAYHLLHGFPSAFQTMGWNHPKYNPLILKVGTAFSIIVPLIFALMPIAMFAGWVK